MKHFLSLERLRWTFYALLVDHSKVEVNHRVVEVTRMNWKLDGGLVERRYRGSIVRNDDKR